MQYSLSLLTTDHVIDTMELLHEFHEASPYKDHSFSEEKVYGVLEDPNVLVLLLLGDGEPVGVLVGAAVESIFSRDKVAVEMAWFVRPEHRKKSDLLREAFEFWAKNKQDCKFSQLTFLNDDNAGRLDKFYKRKGYSPAEYSHIKVL